jgi:hypothetical protein
MLTNALDLSIAAFENSIESSSAITAYTPLRRRSRSGGGHGGGGHGRDAPTRPALALMEIPEPRLASLVAAEDLPSEVQDSTIQAVGVGVSFQNRLKRWSGW